MMADTHWQKQAADKPLFEDLVWSRPQNKRQAGKLLIIGGNGHSFASVSRAYAEANAAGAGVIRAMLPDMLAKTLGKVFPEAEFAPSTPSGSFSKLALGQFLEEASWADGILLAGDFGRNSETAVLLEKLIDKYTGPLIISGDGADYCTTKWLGREKTVICADLGRIQKLAAAGRPAIVIKHGMNLHNLVGVIHCWTETMPAGILTKHEGQIVVGHNGQASTTPGQTDWHKLAAYAAVWQLQQPNRPFEAMTTAVFCAINEK